MSIPFILDGGAEFNAPDEWVETWYRFYSVDYVDMQMRRAAIWTVDNTNNRKTKRGMKKFIGGWLDRNYDSGGHQLKELS